MRTIGVILAEQARQRPDTMALIDASNGAERRLTFHEFEQQVEAAAEWFFRLGLRKGNSVLVLAPMSAELYVALLALFRVGIVALFLDPSAGRAHIDQCCGRWPPDALLAVPRAHLLRFVSESLRRIRHQVSVGGWVPGTRRFRLAESASALVGEDSSAFATRPWRRPGRGMVKPADPALVTFTSGSTGVPKATVRTHGFLVAQHCVLEPSILLEPGDVDLATLPVFTLANLASGVTTVIPSVNLRRPGAVDGRKVLADIERFGVTRVTASPAFFECLLNGLGEKTVPALRKLHTGGAPVFPRLLEALHRAAPNALAVAVYGSTEAEPVAHVGVGEISDDDRQAMQSGRGLLAGMPVPEIDVRILPDRWGTPLGHFTTAQFDAASLPPSQVGEIVVAGEHVLRGYLGGIGNEETKFTVDDETWHRTGDAGWFDVHRRLWLVGRCVAKIDDEHGRLYPFTVECVAMTFPEVRRAAVVAASGRRILVIEGPRQLAERLRSATAWAHIAEIRFLERIPVDKRHNAKIDYPALRRVLGISSRNA